jgi:hypothetical protein
MNDEVRYEKQPKPERKQAVANAADPEQVQRAKESERDARKIELRDLSAVLDTPEGRRVLWRLLDVAGVHRSTFNPHGSISAFNEGMRNVGLIFQKDITDHFPQKYVDMLQEMQRRHDKTAS